MTPPASSHTSVCSGLPSVNSGGSRRAARAARGRGDHRVDVGEHMREQRDLPGGARVVACFLRGLRAPVGRVDDLDRGEPFEDDRVRGGADVELLVLAPLELGFSFGCARARAPATSSRSGSRSTPTATAGRTGRRGTRQREDRGSTPVISRTRHVLNVQQVAVGAADTAERQAAAEDATAVDVFPRPGLHRVTESGCVFVVGQRRHQAASRLEAL
jgi:hypothetical protein